MTNMVGRVAGAVRGKGLAGFLRRFGLSVMPEIDDSGRYSGFRLSWGNDNTEITRGSVVTWSVAGKDVRFFVQNELDEIQGQHRQRQFYEAEELEIISRYFDGGVFVDVGANVGNHSVYALMFLGAERVIAFEPNPKASRILEINVALNQLSASFELHKCGLSDAVGHAQPDKDPRKIDNLGATRLTSSEEGFELVRGDDVIADPVDFIKIDTEGFELRVLSGLQLTIKKCRPVLFVEVDDANLRDFEIRMRELGYILLDRYRRYPGNINIVAAPRDRPNVSAKIDD